MYMNQYRLGSKTLTAAVQPYAVTGDKTYYNNMKELHEDKNCDIAWESLQQDGLTDNEWGGDKSYRRDFRDLKSLPKNMSMASYTFPTVFITILYIFPTL